MNTIENQKEIVQFGVSISQFNIDNLETGLLFLQLTLGFLKKQTSTCISSRNRVYTQTIR